MKSCPPPRKRKATDPAYRNTYTCEPTGCPGTPETWRTAVGLEGEYEVSDHGRVRRTRTGRTRALPGLRPQLRLIDTKPYYVHHLVLEAFVEPRPEGLVCCHEDDNKRNNHVGNLRWDTHSANQHDKVRNGKHHHAIKTHCPRGHGLRPPNLQRSEWAKGHRICLACHRGRARAVAIGVLDDRGHFLAICDAYYRTIMGWDPA